MGISLPHRRHIQFMTIPRWKQPMARDAGRVDGTWFILSDLPPLLPLILSLRLSLCLSARPSVRSSSLFSPTSRRCVSHSHSPSSPPPPPPRSSSAVCNIQYSDRDHRPSPLFPQASTVVPDPFILLMSLWRFSPFIRVLLPTATEEYDLYLDARDGNPCFFWPSIMVWWLERRRRQLCIPLFAPSRPTRPAANDNLQPRSHPLPSLSLSIQPTNFVPPAFHVNERWSLLERDAPFLPACTVHAPPTTWVTFRRRNYGNGRAPLKHQQSSSSEGRNFDGGKRD